MRCTRGEAHLKAAKDVLLRLKRPLVVYPEGEVYHTNDRLTPLREGAAMMALTAQKALDGEVPVFIVPVPNMALNNKQRAVMMMKNWTGL